jgi:hypothetical protein
MLRIPGTPPVKTRLPVAAWAIAGVVTLFSLMSTLLHLPAPSHRAMPQAEQGLEPQDPIHRAKV